MKRNPEPCSGYAKVLFAGDMLAAKSGNMILPHESKEKALLAIAERLGLRGEALDLTHHGALKRLRKRVLGRVIRSVGKMTMTVIDGEFDRLTLAKDNLTFSGFEMDAEKNSLEHYDAKLAKAPSALQGEVIWGLT